MGRPYDIQWRAGLLLRGIQNNTGFHIPTELSNSIRIAWGIVPRVIIEYVRPTKPKKRKFNEVVKRGE